MDNPASRLEQDVVIFQDSQQQYEFGVILPLRNQAGMSDSGQESIWDIQTAYKVVSGSVTTRDYNYREALTPQDSAESIFSREGITTGETYHYAEPFLTAGDTESTESGAYFARLRHERILNAQYHVSGHSSSPHLAPGKVLETDGTLPDAVKEGIVITTVRTSGSRKNSFTLTFEGINAGVMGNMTALAGEKLGLFARTGQLSLKSGEGPVEVQAQNASLRLFAEKKLTLSSASDISFAGKKRITLIGDGSYLRLEAGKVEYGTTATYIRKVKRTMFAGANSTPTPSISMPLVDDLIRNGFFDEQFRILDDSGKPMANVPYFISSENGETFKGVTDNQGLCKRVFSKESAKLTVWLGVLALERW